jgi:small subunit ribosomal protein S20
MPNSSSAIKRMKTTVTRTETNRVRKGRIATSRRNFNDALFHADKDKAASSYREFCSALDKATKSGVVKSNTADRSKARAAKKLSTMG